MISGVKKAGGSARQACELCRQRKVKCNVSEKFPCYSCVKSGKSHLCTFPENAGTPKTIPKPTPMDKPASNDIDVHCKPSDNNAHNGPDACVTSTGNAPHVAPNNNLTSYFDQPDVMATYYDTQPQNFDDGLHAFVASLHTYAAELEDGDGDDIEDGEAGAADKADEANSEIDEVIKGLSAGKKEHATHVERRETMSM